MKLEFPSCANGYGNAGRPTSSASVGRQVEERTHKGGAVLWYLRKHAPMPVPYGSVSLTPSPSLEKLKTKKPFARGVVERPSTKLSAAPQRNLLHDTLLVIGSELDNEYDIDSHKYTHRPHPQGARLDADAMGWTVRESLRKRYAAHTDSELEQLQEAVAAREKEVRGLQRQVQQMERYLAATLAAAAHRAQRLQMTEAPSNKVSGTKSNAGTAPSSRKPTVVGLTEAAQDDASKGKTENVIEEWQDSMMRQGELVQKLRSSLDEQCKALHQQTIRRKALEATLFCSRAMSLKLSAQAQQTEDRVQRMANELKQIYKSMPGAIKKRLGGQNGVCRKNLTETEVMALKAEYYGEFCKYMDEDAIEEETQACAKRITEIDEFVLLAQNVGQRGGKFAEEEMAKFQSAHVAIGALLDRWARFQLAGHAAGELVLKDIVGEKPENADSMLQNTNLCVNKITELLNQLKQNSPDDRTSRSSEAKSSRKRQETKSELAPRKAHQICVCGNVFMEDSKFCRKCGARRVLREDEYTST
jgi:hypothetical protein